ncbi:MAG: response regulator transcription factor [Clostridiales bacterium]|nr:response regulator transcription factor [Clostridiales bacterium]
MIVEDQELVRKYFEDTVNKSRHFTLSFSISNADLADIYCQKNKIDLIIMDVYTDYGANGLQASARIKEKYPGIKIIIVTSMPEFSYLEQARKAGVESFVYKELNYDSFLDIMERTMDGESIYPDETPEVMLGQASSKDFTYRELEILREITSGDTNEEIAERMYLSVSTVKTHIMNLMQKTGFKSRTELAIKARESGLVIK